MFLKILVYSVAIWFFIRILRRFVRVWLGVPLGGSINPKFNQSSSAPGSRRIDDVEEAVFTEIDDKH
jgi:hypothetical protein